MRWGELIRRREEKKNAHRILVEKYEGKTPLEKDLEVDEMILSKLILNKCGWMS